MQTCSLGSFFFFRRKDKIWIEIIEVTLYSLVWFSMWEFPRGMIYLGHASCSGDVGGV